MKDYRNAIKPAALAAASVLMFAFAGQAAEITDREGKVAETLRGKNLRIAEEKTSLSNFTLSGFEAIDDSNLIVSSGTRDSFLISLVNPCLELPFALSIGFERRSTNISNFDSIIVNSQNRQGESCRIERIFRLEDAGTESAE